MRWISLRKLQMVTLIRLFACMLWNDTCSFRLTALCLERYVVTFLLCLMQRNPAVISSLTLLVITAWRVVPRSLPAAPRRSINGSSPPPCHCHAGSWSGCRSGVRPAPTPSAPGPGSPAGSDSGGRTSPAPGWTPRSSGPGPPPLQGQSRV